VPVHLGEDEPVVVVARTEQHALFELAPAAGMDAERLYCHALGGRVESFT
jgi:hypothetical protein